MSLDARIPLQDRVKLARLTRLERVPFAFGEQRLLARTISRMYARRLSQADKRNALQRRRALVLPGRDFLVGIMKFAANVCSPDTNKNTNKADGCRGLLRAFSMRRGNFSGKYGIELAT